MVNSARQTRKQMVLVSCVLPVSRVHGAQADKLNVFPEESSVSLAVKMGHL